MPAACSWSSRPLSIVARRPAAKIVTKTTSARPIISADAVTAVRCGWRAAFSRARRPVRPWMRSSGRPIALLSGRTSTGAISATPKIIRTAPRPISDAVVAAVPGSPNSAISRTARPASSTSAAATMRRLRRRPTVGACGLAHRLDRDHARRAARRARSRRRRGDHADQQRRRSPCAAPARSRSCRRSSPNAGSRRAAPARAAARR